MKIIKQIIEDIQDELEGAEHYAKLATQYRETDKAIADNYARMAQTELNHVNDLHGNVVRLIEAHKKTGAEVPEAMQAVWDWEHEKMVDTSARVKSLLAIYRGE